MDPFVAFFGLASFAAGFVFGSVKLFTWPPLVDAAPGDAEPIAAAPQHHHTWVIEPAPPPAPRRKPGKKRKA